MVEAIKKPRREFRNINILQILKYRLPPSGKVSILHRISGALLFLFLPFSLCLFEQSLSSEISFYALKGFVSHIAIKGMILALAWAFLFHFFAGVRHLLMDLHIADTKRGGNNTAVVVLAVSTLVTIAIALKLFGLF